MFSSYDRDDDYLIVMQLDERKMERIQTLGELVNEVVWDRLRRIGYVLPGVAAVMVLGT